MKMQPVESSNVKSVGWDEQEKVLLVQFHSGATYRYEGVGEVLWRDFWEAPSKGRWVARHLHGWPTGKWKKV